MPTTRRSSAVPSTPPPPTFELPRSPKTRSSSAKPRSSYQAPGVRSHHHRSADELALEEAAKLLHATPTSLAHDGMGIEDLDGSTRSSRHKRLTEARHLQGEEERETAVEAPELADEVNGAQDEAFPSAKDSEEGDAEHGPGSNDNDRGRLEEAVIQADQESVPGSEKEVQAPAGLDTPIVSAILPTSENEDSTGGSDSSTDSSDSDIDSEETSDTGTEEEEENSDEEDERLEKLLQAARVSAVAKDFGVGNGGGAGENGEEVMLQFDKPDDPPRKEA